MRRSKLLAVAIALLPCVVGTADEMTYSSLLVDSAVEPVSFAAPPGPDTTVEVVGAGYDPMSTYDASTGEMLAYPPQVVYPEDGCRHWFGGIDLGSTTVRHSNGSFAFDKHRTRLSVRPYIGCENSDGVGFRGQIWLFGTKTQVFTTGTAPPFDLEAGTFVLDLDLYKRLQLDATSLVLGVGSRIAGVGWTFPDDSEDHITAGGLSAFIDGYHPFHTTPHSEWGCIGGARISALSGTADLDNSSAYSRTDSTLQITEVNMGIQYRRYYESYNFLAQLRFEEQLWNTNIFSEFAYSTTGLRVGWEW